MTIGARYMVFKPFCEYYNQTARPTPYSGCGKFYYARNRAQPSVDSRTSSPVVVASSIMERRATKNWSEPYAIAEPDDYISG